MQNVQHSEDELTPQLGRGDIHMEEPSADGGSKYKDITGNLKRAARTKSKTRY